MSTIFNSMSRNNRKCSRVLPLIFVYINARNKFMLEKSKFPGMYNRLSRPNLKCAGHLNRLEDNTLAKQVLFS